jgi:formylglycine-generating enzyme required for sulfatase activity
VLPPPTIQAIADAKTLTNSIGMKLVLIPAGEFQMGSSEAEIKRLVGEAKAQNESAETLDRLSQEGPQHRVRISRSFYLGACEVTVGQFRAFVQAEDYRTEAEKDGKGGSGTDPTTAKLAQGPRFTWQNVGRPQQDDHPVVNVTWNDCLAFCNWLSRKEQAAYRLPTEAQWEYACRAGSPGRFCFGDLEAALREHAWFDLDLDKDVARPVAGKKPNAWGLYDMHGNVWEWCADRFGEDAYARAADDPAGPSAGSRRVIRGGGFFSRPLKCRSAFRFDEDPAGRGHYSGFRVVRSLEPAAGELREKPSRGPDKDRMLSVY